MSTEIPTWLVKEKRYGRWSFRVKAQTPAEAVRFARACGFTEPATIERLPSVPVIAD
ncbi:MAG: hypothetical protein JXA90_09080 [Planctomycetes bacterium]|nr:hypothetical protein [Planctomycetota bacterium]